MDTVFCLFRFFLVYENITTFFTRMKQCTQKPSHFLILKAITSPPHYLGRTPHYLCRVATPSLGIQPLFLFLFFIPSSSPFLSHVYLYYTMHPTSYYLYPSNAESPPYHYLIFHPLPSHPHCTTARNNSAMPPQNQRNHSTIPLKLHACTPPQ